MQSKASMLREILVVMVERLKLVFIVIFFFEGLAICSVAKISPFVMESESKFLECDHGEKEKISEIEPEF